MVREIADRKNFGFPDSGKEKGHQKIPNRVKNPVGKKLFHIFGVILTIFDKKLMFKGKNVNLNHIL